MNEVKIMNIVKTPIDIGVSLKTGRELAKKISDLDYIALAELCDRLTMQDKERADWISNLLDRLSFDKDIESGV